jgi:hypothetical protein
VENLINHYIQRFEKICERFQDSEGIDDTERIQLGQKKIKSMLTALSSKHQVGAPLANLYLIRGLFFITQKHHFTGVTGLLIYT